RISRRSLLSALSLELLRAKDQALPLHGVAPGLARRPLPAPTDPTAVRRPLAPHASVALAALSDVQPGTRQFRRQPRPASRRRRLSRHLADHPRQAFIGRRKAHPDSNLQTQEKKGSTMTSNIPPSEETKATRLMRRAILHELYCPSDPSDAAATDKLQQIARALVQ